MKKTLILAAAMTVLFLAPNQRLFSQTKDDAGNAYNNARTLAATDKSGALKGMIEVVSMCEKVGADADDIKKMASAVIPDWQYQIANDLLKEKKYDEESGYNQLKLLYKVKCSRTNLKETFIVVSDEGKLGIIFYNVENLEE